MNDYKLAIVGATGVVGQTIIKVLEEKNLPISEYYFYASSKSKGKTIKFKDDVYVIDELTEDSFNNNFDFAIFSAGGNTALKYAPIAAQKGCTVIDNSSAFRMDSMVPLVVPEVNSEEISKNNGIIANPNCSTIQAVVALKPLDTKYNIKRIVYSTYQAVSGAGSKGIHDLENGISNYLNDNSIYDLEKFNYPIFNNCLPHIDVFLENGYTKEEEKMINETRKILNKPNLPITATTVRVPVFNCHCESINIEFEKEFELDDIINTLKNSPGIIVEDDCKQNIYSIPTKVSGNDNVYVSRIRRDFSVKNGINIWVVADNIRKGAASNAIQILEKLL
ncbi:MAG: aspartate-semialdehyde dehydrogenase [Clostridiales bacterium]|nr:aspartate-semialdehyde dehydrogenase [Clostridiales bacterium]